MKHKELIKNCDNAVKNVITSKHEDTGLMFYDERRMFMMKSKLEMLER